MFFWNDWNGVITTVVFAILIVIVGFFATKLLAYLLCKALFALVRRELLQI